MQIRGLMFVMETDICPMFGCGTSYDQVDGQWLNSQVTAGLDRSTAGSWE